MTPEERQNHCYLGDGVYVESTPHHMILRTGDHRDSHCDNKIYLEQDVLIHLLEWVAHLKHIKNPSIVQNLDLSVLFEVLRIRCEKKELVG